MRTLVMTLVALGLGLGCGDSNGGGSGGSGGGASGGAAGASTGPAPTGGTGGRAAGGAGGAAQPATGGTGGQSPSTSGGAGGSAMPGAGGRGGAGGGGAGGGGSGGGGASGGGASGAADGGVKDGAIAMGGAGGGAKDGGSGSLDASGNLGPAAALDGQRWQTPCTNPEPGVIVCDQFPPGMSSCPAGGYTTTNKTITFGGTPGTVYDVRVRIRGVFEPKRYTGGMSEPPHWYVGGNVGTTVYNVVSLAISSPAQTYYLNHDDGRGEEHYVFPVDHVKTIKIAAGATVTLRSHDPNCSLIRNCMMEGQTCTPYTFPDVPLPPANDTGQFAQLNVLSVSPAP